MQANLTSQFENVACVTSVKMDFPNNKAIFLSENGKVKNTLTYQDVTRIRNLISDFIRENFKEKHLCIGLKMTHNLYIPSIVLSLQELEYAFIFLSTTDDSDIIAKQLGIACVLSFEAPHWTSKLNLGNAELFLERNVNAPCKYYENIHYIIRTSGTTGQNKFVRVTKSCIQSNITSLSRIFKITQNDVIYFGTPLTFDPSMIELLLAIENGASLLITTPKSKLSPTFLYNTLFHPQNGISVLQIVPSLFMRWSQEQICSILQNQSLKILAFGGEQFPQSVLKYQKWDQLRIFNLYGITEMSCWASIYETSLHHSAVIPIGSALTDTIIEIRDDSGGVNSENEGEIYIGSHSRICLVDDEDSSPIFRATGDIGFIRDGTVYYKGRKNDVIKRLGHKIHLTQIEGIVERETGLNSKCVWCKTQSKLLLFLICDQYNDIDKVIDKIRIKLLHSLPKHYFPDFIDMIQKCPITINGKIDTNALVDMYLKRDKRDKNFNSAESFKWLICKYFGLGHDQLKDLGKMTFFELGGNSVLAIQLLNEFQNEINTEYPPELVTCLFESDLNSCFDFLKNVQIDNKPKLQKCESIPSRKKVKRGEIELKIGWTYNMYACVDSSPLVFQNGDKVFVAVGSFSHIFAVVDGLTGKEVSKFVLPDVIEGSPCVSPCSKYLYVGCFDGNMYNLHYMNGEIKWTYSTSDRIKCKPVLCRGSRSIVFGSYDKYAHCINIYDGTPVWKTLLSESVISAPIVKNAKIHLSTISGTCLCLSETNGEILWRWKCPSAIFGDSCFFRNSIIVPNVQGKILSLTNNGEKNWEFECGGHLYSSMLSYQDLVIFGCHDRNLYFLRVGDRPELVKTVNLESKISRTASLCDVKGDISVVVGCDDGCVFVVDLGGFVMGEIRLPNQVFSSAFVFGSSIYIGCRDNNLYCINFE